MEIWPADNQLLKLKQGAWLLFFIILVGTIELGTSADQYPALVSEFSFNKLKAIYVSVTILVILTLGILYLNTEAELKRFIYGYSFYLAFVLSFLFANIFWLINTHYDNSTPYLIVAKVVKKVHHVSKGGGGQHIIIKDKNTPASNYTMNVPRHFFYTIQKGNTVKLWVKAGVFKRPWVAHYQLTNCKVESNNETCHP